MRGIPGVGDRIDQRRVALGWRSLTDFALDNHHSPQIVHAWVRRGQTPHWDMLEKLALELKCPLAWLILGDRVFEEIPALRAFYEELHGKPLEERPISGIEGVDDAKARSRLRFWHYLDLRGSQPTEIIER